MTDSAPATRLARPRWRDTRLLLGVLLVMTSVVVGSRVLAGAERSEQVWTVATDLAIGTRLTSADLEPRAVRLGPVSGNYLLVAAGTPVGATLARAVSAGDLLPSAALTATGDGPDRVRQVTVPVAAFHYPHDLARGRLVDVYVTPGGDAGAGVAPPDVPQRLVSAALVVAVDDGGSSGFGGVGATIGVLLSVPDDEVAALVAGLHEGPVDLVRVSGP